MKPIVRLPADEGGATLVLVAMMLTALLSAVALAVDVGMLMTARSEAQRTADAAALAAAGSLIYFPGDEDKARQTAIDLAAVNTIIGDPVEMLPEDLSIDLGAGRVVAIVRRTQARGNPMATWFARVFGVDVVDVSARAVAQVVAGAGAACLKPWTIPDGWYDANGNGFYDEDGIEYYDPHGYGYGTESGSDFRNTVYTNNTIDPPGTTYVKDRGRPIKLKPGNNDQTIQSSWYFPWNIPQADGSPAVGASRYRWNIAHCNPTLITLGEEYMVETGNMVGPTRQGVEELIAQDPQAQWNVSEGTIVNSAFDPPESSPRVVNIPLFDPTYPVAPGKKPLVFNNMTAFWIEEMQGSNVVGRFMALSGVGVAGADTMPLIRFPRLIE